MISERLAEEGIRLQSSAPGGRKVTCPKCSSQRRNKTDPCLSVTIDDDEGAVWMCHHCGTSGNLPPRRMDDGYPPHGHRQSKSARAPKKIDYRPDPLPPHLVQWFAAHRGIRYATLERNGVGCLKTWMPGCERGETVEAITFPYRRSGEVVNIKYRSLAKAFRLEKGAEKIFCGLDDIEGADTVIIVEGELDKLALEEAGFINVLSVPHGAPKKVKDGAIDPAEDAKFAFVWNGREALKSVGKIILATDGDGPGQALAEELARRLGRERCWRVTWPERNDANQVLVEDGPEVLREVIEAAEPYPIRSLQPVSRYRGQVHALYRNGRRRALSTGWPRLDEFMTIREGELSIVTGIPNSGKSEFIDALCVNLARQYGWRFALCSFENPPDEHLAKLAEKHVGQPFRDGPRPRMGEGDLDRALDWAQDHFSFIRAEDEAPTIDLILEAAKAAVMRYGIRGLVVDPYNEIEHRRPANRTETEYVSEVPGRLKRFAAGHSVHVWLVAHPAKMQREGRQIPAPTLYDISGSANFANKADLGVVVHRVPSSDPPDTEIFIRKCRFKQIGRIGKVTLGYERSTGRYIDRDIGDHGLFKSGMGSAA